MTMNVGPLAITLSRSGHPRGDDQKSIATQQAWPRILSVMGAVSALTFGILVAVYELLVR